MKKEFDPTKPVQTRNGKSARIICTDRKGLFPILALVVDSNKIEKAFAYNKKGELCGCPGSVFNLINILNRTSKFRNIWSSVSAQAFAYNTMKEALSMKGPSERLGVLELKYEEGVFIDAVFHYEFKP
jgi:hypothetical protein